MKLTQKQKETKALLLERLARGPSSLIGESANRYYLWAKTWIIPLVEELVPEPKPKKEN